MQKYLDPFLLRELQDIVLSYCRFGGVNIATLNSTEWIMCLAILPQEDFIAAGSENGTIEIRNLRTGQVDTVLVPRERPLGILGLETLPNGILVAMSYDSIQLWDVNTKTHQLLAENDRNDAFRYLKTFDNFVAATSSNGFLRIWNVNTLKQELVLKSSRGKYGAMTVLPTVNNGKRIAVAAGSYVEIVNVSAKCTETILEQHNTVTHVITTPDNKLITASGNSISTWDLSSCTVRHKMRIDSEVRCLAILLDNFSISYRVVVGSDDTKIWVFSFDPEPKLNMILRDHTSPVGVVLAFPDATLISCSYKDPIRVWI